PHRQVLRDLRDNDRADHRRVSIGLHDHGRSLLPAHAGRMGEADEDDVTPVHGSSGKASYSSMSSQPACLPASHASAWSSSLVQGWSWYSPCWSCWYSLRRSKTKASPVRGLTRRSEVLSESSSACSCCSVNSIIGAPPHPHRTTAAPHRLSHQQ